MREGIQRVKKEAYISSYSDSLGKGIEVHSILLCLKGQTVMCFDAVRESGSLWFMIVEEPRVESLHMTWSWQL